jgi:hypothetical protein
MLHAKPWQHPCYTVCRYPPVSSNQLFHPLHSCFCRNLNRATWSGLICVFQMSLREFLDPIVNRLTGQTLPTVNKKHFFMNILCTESFCPQKSTTKCRTSVVHLARSTFWLLKPASTCACACYLDCHSRTVLLPSDTHRKPTTSITAVLFPFMTYLLTLPRT